MFCLWKEIKNVFRLKNNGRIKVSEEALKVMNSYKQNSISKFEAGGVLMGRFIIGSKNIIVDKVTTPMKGDIRTINRFIRSEKHQEIVFSEWVKSNHTSHYLGEWHTHPENFPKPSNIDRNNWIEKIKSATFSSRFLYFIIVGNKEYGIWEGDRRTFKIRKTIKYG